jgi:hypothetical protein
MPALSFAPPSLLSYLFMLSLLLSFYSFPSFPTCVPKYHYIILFVFPQTVSLILFSVTPSTVSLVKTANFGIITMNLFVFFSYFFLFLISKCITITVFLTNVILTPRFTTFIIFSKLIITRNCVKESEFPIISHITI